MVTVPAIFHTACKAQSPKTRIRIYFIGDSVDCTDDNAVQTDGTLLVYEQSDTDSNRRINISASPVTFTEYYNPNVNLQIGRCPSNTVQMTLLNDDGALSSSTFGRCKIYIDLYAGGAWIPVPMGVYIISTPKKRLVSNIQIQAYDQMQLLETAASDWWNNVFSDDRTAIVGRAIVGKAIVGVSSVQSYKSSDYIQSMCAALGIRLNTDSLAYLCNDAYTFSDVPFDADDMTYRDLLSYFVEANGCCAFFNRDGALEIAPCFNFSAASADYGYSYTSGVFDYSQAEYTARMITGVSIKSSNNDVGVESGSGNMYLITENALLNALPDNNVAQQFADNICNAFDTYLDSYRPTSFRAVGDWSLCASDVIQITIGSALRLIPIMQQTLSWSGGSVMATISATGDEKLPELPNRVVRTQMQTNRTIHKLNVSADELSSVIQSVNDNYSAIVQTLESIEQRVGNAEESLSVVINSNSSLWQFTRQLRDDTNNQFSEIGTYIRFTNEPAIILGTNTGNEIKLKLNNNVIYFFNGADDSTDFSKAFAYVSSEGISTGWVTTSDRLQVGNNTSDNWLWHMTANGNLVLDLV